jgi:membrane protease YdiL (CAAX protease family)
MQRVEGSRPDSACQDGAGQTGNRRSAFTAVSDSFLLTLLAASGLALGAAVIIAPMAAMAVSAAGFSFPFPRIFDRTVMVTLFATLLVFARPLRLHCFLRNGFANAQAAVWRGLSGVALAASAIGVLFALAAIAGGSIHGGMIAASMLRYLPAAILIAAIEEAFFRAFLLTGMEDELGSSGALLASSAIFALVHVIRSPAHFYLIQFRPLAGAKTLALYVERVFHLEVGPSLLGLFLLGIVLGQAFVLTRQVYCSLGLHVGFVLGAKTWRVGVGGAIPRWLAGPGAVPLIAAPAAWLASAIMLGVLRLWLSPTKPESLSA